MPDCAGVPPPDSSPVHASSQQWQSFEARMRRRRFVRCVLRAEVALQAGFDEDARAALDEAHQLDDGAPDLAELTRRVAQPKAAPRTPWARRLLPALTVGLMLLGGGAIAWRIAGPAEMPGVAGSGGGTRALRPDVVLPAPADVVAVVTTDVVPIIADGIPPAPEPEPVAAEAPTERAAVESPPPPPPPEPATDVPRVSRAAPVRAESLPRSRPEAASAPPAVVPALRGADSSPPVRRASAPEPAATPAVDEGLRVRAVLARYEAAYSELDAAAAEAVWPGVNEPALTRAFDALRSQQLQLGRCDVSISDGRASVDCAGSASWTPKVGSGRTEPRRWHFDLQNAEGGWLIVRAEAR